MASSSQHPLPREELARKLAEALRMVPDLLDDYSWLRMVGYERVGTSGERVHTSGTKDETRQIAHLSGFHKKTRSKVIRASKQFHVIVDAAWGLRTLLTEIENDIDANIEHELTPPLDPKSTIREVEYEAAKEAQKRRRARGEDFGNG